MGRILLFLGVVLSAACQSDAPCDTTCTNAVESVSWDDSHGKCSLAFDIPCFPWGCDGAGKYCNTSCNNDTQCASGAACNITTGECAAVPSTCLDPFTLKQANGSEISCLPYQCRAGVCRETCQVDAECGTGYVCRAPNCYAL